jgi:DNA-binding SARP family transcriptional activator/predicted ATPase
MALDSEAMLSSRQVQAMARLNLSLLGGFQGRVGVSAPLALPTRKTQALLAFLALPPGRPHPREKLASLLWGGMREPRARSGLRQSLFTLRKAVNAMPPALLIDGQTVALNPTAVDVDVVEFERRVAEGTPAALERATTLYRGDLLEGLALQEAPFEEWLLAERERLHELALEAQAKLLHHQRTTGATEAALQTALRLLALDPLQEPVHRAVMRLYVQLGRRASALRQYQICVGTLQRELGVEPETTTRQLYREILRRRPSPGPPGVEGPATPPAGSTTVPHPPDETLSRELPLVGREAEIRRLRDMLDRMWDGHGQVAAVIGEAGVGKSRLLAEIAAEAVARGARVLVGRCYEAEQILPFASWVDALRAGHVDDREVLDGLAPPWRAELARLLPELGLPGPGPARSPVDYRQLFESVAQLLRLLARLQPVVLILEDLHWGDEMGLRLLAFVGRRLQTCPVLVVGSAREEDVAGAPLLGRTLEALARDARLVELHLAPLSRDETRTLVRTLAGSENDEAVLTRLEEEVWSVSEGNPFAVVETVRALPDGFATDPSTKLAIPRRVRDVIARHLDALSERGRDLTTVAAVIGREFDFALLRRSAGLEESDAAESLEELVRRRVLHSVGERFDFTHDRIREVAYGRLLRERQRALHARIVDAMETLYADRLAEQVERLAHHAARGELGEKAVAYLRQAGAKAFANSAHADALAFFTQALRLLGQLAPGAGRDREELSLRLARGPALQATRGFATPEVEQNFARARQLADAVGTPVQQFQALWGIWLVASHRATAGVALELGRELLALAEGLDDPALLLEGHHALWPVLVWLGSVEAARRHLDLGLALYDKAQHRSHAFVYGGHDPGVCCLKVASWASWILGYPDRGLEESFASLGLARELDHPMSTIVALVWACVFRDLRREIGEVGQHAGALIALSTEHEASQWLAAGTIMDASARVELGEGQGAIARIGRGLAAYGSTGAHLFVPYFLSLLAKACLKTGQPHDGLRVVGEALERARTTGERVWEAELLRLEGELWLAARPDDVTRAADCFRRAIEVARGQAARSWELRATLSLARLLAAAGRHDEARHALAGVYAWFTEGFDTADLRDARAFLASSESARQNQRERH